MLKMTDEQRMMCIMAYPNAQPIATYLAADPEDWDGYKIHSICMGGGVNLIHSDHGICWMHITDLQILLRPVSSLTDEEYREIADLLGKEKELIPDEWHEKRFAALGIKDVEPSVKLRNIGKRELEYMKGTYTGAIIDYLRSINIITTVHGFDLVAEGIAIVDDKIGEI